MKLPVIQGVIERRILANYQVDPEILRRVVPAPFRPKTVGGAGIAGVCLIRLAHMRPRFVPSLFGFGSENAAHRIAVEWDDAGERKEGVFVPRRDTSSLLNIVAGGRAFPGEQHRAKFEVCEADGLYRVELKSDDGETRVLVEGRLTDRMPEGSVFSSVEDASKFFEAGSVGYSACAEPGRYDGLELKSFERKVEPLAVTRIESSFFENEARFPPGSVKFDSALLMRGIPHEWRARESMRNSGRPEASRQ